MYTYVVCELQNGVIGGNSWVFNDPAKTDIENQNAAMAKYHSVLAVAALSSVPVHSCVIIRDDGIQIASEGYDRRVVEE